MYNISYRTHNHILIVLYNIILYETYYEINQN